MRKFQIKVDNDDDDMFEISKSKKKQTNKKQAKKPSRLKKNDDDYQPEEQQESSESDLLPSSEDEQPIIKNQRRNTTTSIRQSKKITTNNKQTNQKKQTKQEKQEKQNVNNQEEEEPQISVAEQRDAEEFFQAAEALLPDFVQPDNIRDMEGRRPNHPDYDPSTLNIPITQYQKLPPMFRQYWNAKKVHFDTVVFFRCGRWNNVLYQDAILIAKLFQRHLGFWGKDRPCLTIYDSQLPIYQRVLLEKGYKVLLVEQLERADMANKDDGEIVRREITQLISRGTFQDLGENDSYEARNLIVIVCQNAPVNNKGHKYIYGISIVDCTTNTFYFDQFFDDSQSNTLRSLLYKTKPIEAILSKVSQDVEKMIKSISNPIIINSKREFQDCEYIFEQIKNEYLIEVTKSGGKQRKTNFDGIYIPEKIEIEIQGDIDINQGLYSESKQIKQIQEQIPEQKQLTLSEEYPNILIEFEKQYYFDKEKKSQEQEEQSEYYSYYLLIQAFYIQLCYLRQLLINNTVYRRGQFYLMDSKYSQKNNLYLDSQALESLEVFEVNLQTKFTTKGSLFDYLDRCSTPFGKRLLVKWVQNPLLDYKEIIQRQECIKDLIENLEICDEFQKRLKPIPDLERNIIKCFNTIHSHKLKALPVQGGDSFGKIKLKEIIIVIKHIKSSSDIFKMFDNYIKKFKSIKLKKIVNSQEHQTKITNAIKELEKCLIMKDGEPQPLKGVSPEYDQTYEKHVLLLQELDEELEKWKKYFKCPEIIYTQGKIRFQLEIPDNYLEKIQKPRELIITSKRKGFQRFHSEFIEQKLYLLRNVEDELLAKLLPFINEYFTKFYSYRKEFYELINAIAEIDCLISLAQVSKTTKFSTFPEFIQPGPDDEIEQQFNLVDAYHPCLIQNRDIKWIPNSIQFTNKIDTLLLTGPNMSGKSTLLRLVGISILLAQIGCAVPAKSFILVPFDRIFCRLGASDRLLEGKSTFFIELEETKTVLDHATARSLVIIDELGRGTSTYDGVALASAVLRFLTQKIRPKMLFATHYHILLDEFALCKNILQCVMKHYQDKDQVIFEYKLIKGTAQKSFATNVAKIAGIPIKVVKQAQLMEQKITTEESKINKNREILKKFNEIINTLM